MLHRVKEERNIVSVTKHRKVHCFGNNLFRNGLHRHSIEENKRKYARDRKMWKKSEHRLDDRLVRRRYWKLKEDAQDRTPWKTRNEKCYGLVTRENNYTNYSVLKLHIF